jgi:uncharacterized membrane protein YfcA
MIVDPLFYAAALPAVMLTGLSKGGFGGAFGFAAVPLIALVIPPVQAAGLMLPILIVMDAVAVIAYRRNFDRSLVLRLMPSALVGTAAGWATANYVSDDVVRLVVGAIALVFLARIWLHSRTMRLNQKTIQPVALPKPSTAAAHFWGGLTGYTSFIAHAGGPPFQTYVVPLRLDPVSYAATSAIFFAVLNAVKVVPYAALGQFDAETLTTAAVLAPVAIASTWYGVKLVRRLDERLFYRILTISILVITVKLIFDGLSNLASV